MVLNEDWLNLTPEEPIDVDLPICDSHHHLTPNYTINDFLRDISGGHNIIKTVFSGGEPPYQLIHDIKSGYNLVKNIISISDHAYEMFNREEITKEIKYIAKHCGEVKSKTNVAAGMIGYVNLFLGKTVASEIESQIIASDNRFRSVRIITCWDESPLFKHPPTNKDMMYDTKFREGINTLGKYNLNFDAWVYFHQLFDLVDLARATPKTAIILNHIGGPLGIGQYSHKRSWVTQEWRRGIAALATCENVYVKLGGLGIEACGFGWNKQKTPPTSSDLSKIMSPYYLFCIDKFGVNRCMFESNFPVDKRSYSYSVLWNAYKLIVNDFSPDERKALFHDNAVHAYRL